MTMKTQLRRSIRVYLTACTLVMSVLMAAPVYSQFSMCASPCVAAQNITPNVDASVALQWRGEVEVVGDGVAVTSKSGSFMVGDASKVTTLGVVNTPLRLTVAAQQRGSATSPFTISETINVPVSISRRAQSLGANQLYYVRDFTANGVTLRASYAIAIASFSPNSSESIREGSQESVSALGLNHIELQFTSGQKVEIVGANEALTARALINFDRAGRFDAVWEVATPSTTVGTPVYRSLNTVQQYFASGGQTRLESPLLPTKNIGVYRVRLRFTTPASEQPLAPITLSYQVVEKNKQAIPARTKTTVSILSPAPNVVVENDTEFSWDELKGVLAYQIEVFTNANPDTLRPLTGVQLKPNTTSATLTATVFNKLQLGQTYYWRVVAFDRQGNVMASSELRPIRTSK